MNMKTKTYSVILIIIAIALSISACSGTTETVSKSSEEIVQVAASSNQAVEETSSDQETVAAESSDQSEPVAETSESETVEAAVVLESIEGSMLDVSEMFTERDLEQTADLSEAKAYTVENDSEILISEEGVYVISGEATNSMITVEADDEAKVQLVLDGVNVVNDTQPVIYVKSADKVFVTTTDSVNVLEVSNANTTDGETNLDAAIFSKSDLVLNGTGTLEVTSGTGNGITSKDDLKITGGTLIVDAKADGLEANDSIRIYDGGITITSDKDALHSEYDEDLSVGSIYITGGELNISAANDAIRGTTIVQINGGVINIETCAEGIEGTYVQINGGTTTIYATDDAINATAKSSYYEVAIEFNGGIIDLTVGSGDTDAVDSNGNIYINGGTITISASSSFDVNGNGVIDFTGGDVIVNGQVMTEIVASQQGGGKPGRDDGKP